jgi:ABC-type transporter Mla subunit MlaD
MSDWRYQSARVMTGRLSRFLRGLYEPLLVILVVGTAGLLFYALYHALGGGRDKSISFDAAFDDVTGIKERSSVLFKGMPVGTVGLMKYDQPTDKILVRIDIKKPWDIPANIKPYVESSLMGQSSIALRTEITAGTPQLLVDAISNYQATNRERFYRLEGVRLSRAESLMPGFDMRAQATMTAASEAMTVASDAMTKMKELASDWRKLSVALVDGKNQTVNELEKVTATLDQAGQAVVRSESQFRKLGIASEKLSEASDSVKVFMDMIKLKPNSLIWGMSEQQRSMLNQQEARHSKSAVAGKR